MHFWENELSNIFVMGFFFSFQQNYCTLEGFTENLLSKSFFSTMQCKKKKDGEKFSESTEIS